MASGDVERAAEAGTRPAMRLAIIGGGRVGKALGRLLVASQRFRLVGLCDITATAAEEAVAFIGTGKACRRVAELPAADVLMIATPDDHVAKVADQAVALPWTAAIAFHTSGALSSDALAPLTARGTAVASLHPLRSFAQPAKVVSSFAGTYCTLEGDDRACDSLRVAIESLGGYAVQISPNDKPLYHAAGVMACNNLVALLDVTEGLLEQSGIDTQHRRGILAPLVRETVENWLTLGPERALTGPVARGDSDTVAAELAELRSRAPHAAELYRLLGTAALDIARRAGLDTERAARVKETLE